MRKERVPFQPTIEDLAPELNPQFGKMSDKYVTVNTMEIVQGLLGKTIAGKPAFELRQIQMKSNHKGIHIVKLKFNTPYKIGGEELHPELILKNSYDGRSKMEGHMGVFRIFCGNGLVVTLKDLGSIKVRHMGTSQEIVADLIEGMAKNLGRFVEVQEQLVDRVLTEEEAVDFAMKAAKIRWDKEFTTEQAKALLQPTRPQDEGDTLWIKFNIVQEKAIQGCKVEGFKKMKPITRAQSDLETNTALFELAMSFIETPEAVADETFTEIPTVEVVTDFVEEVADLKHEVVEIPKQPTKYLYDGTRRFPNPAYARWMENFSDLV